MPAAISVNAAPLALLSINFRKRNDNATSMIASTKNNDIYIAFIVF